MRWRKRDEAVSDDFVRDRQRERLGVLNALMRAQDQRDEVVAALAAASGDEEAQQAVLALLDLEEPVHAMAVLDMQLRWMTLSNRERVRAERDELRAAIEDRG